MRRLSRCLIMLALLLMTLPVLAQDNEDTDITVGELPITGDVNYIVRAGDTLDTVGSFFDVSPICIAQMNDFTIYDWVDAGTEILIPVSCPRYAEDPAYFPTGIVEIPREVVNIPECDGLLTGSADTVESLATMLNVTPEALMEANQLTEDSTLRMQMCLVIPALEDSTLGAGGGAERNGQFYVIGLRESLDEIAFKFNVSLQSIILANNIEAEDVDGLLAGQTIFIPGDAPPYGQFPAMQTVNGDTTLGAGGGLSVDGETYVLQLNDTLDEVAFSLDVSLQSLIMANGIDHNQVDKLMPGTVLVIPTDGVPYGQYPPMFSLNEDGTLGAGGLVGAEGETYVLQPMDTMESIARQHNVSTAALMEANGNPNVLKLLAGTVILIPQDAPPFAEPNTIPAPNFTPVDSDDEEAVPAGEGAQATDDTDATETEGSDDNG
jgi:LysM repeat protein